jgi:hypothetical protein
MPAKSRTEPGGTDISGEFCFSISGQAKADASVAYHDCHVRNLRVRRLQCDEI